MTEHSPCSPSQWEKVAACPSYLQISGPSAVPHPTASKGTLIHKVVETGQTELLTDPADLKVVNAYWEYVNQIEDRAQIAAKPTIYNELRVDVLGEWGYIDKLFVWNDGTADMVDLKTGWLAVTDAEENDQMAGYSLGVFDRFPEIYAIRIHLVIPNRYEVSQATYVRDDDYLRLKHRAQWILTRRQELNEKVFLPSPAACEYCDRKSSCAAFLGLLLPLAKKYDEEFVIPEEAHPSCWTTAGQFNLGMKLAKIMKRWTESATHHANLFLDEGYTLPDFERKEVAGSPVIVEPEIAAKVAVEQFGVPPEDVLKIAKLSFKDLCDLVVKGQPRGSKGNVKQRFEIALAAANALVPGTPRKEIRAKVK